MVAEVTMDDGFVDSSDDEDDMIDVGDLYQDEDEDEDEDEVEDSEDECNGMYIHVVVVGPNQFTSLRADLCLIFVFATQCISVFMEQIPSKKCSIKAFAKCKISVYDLSAMDL